MPILRSIKEIYINNKDLFKSWIFWILIIVIFYHIMILFPYYNDNIIKIREILQNISITVLFALVIIIATNETNREQRNFEIRKKEYNDSLIRLNSLVRWSVSLWKLESINSLKLWSGLYDKYILDINTEIEAWTNSITFFPELHILEVSINNYYQEWKESNRINSEKMNLMVTWLHILKCVVLVKRKMIEKKLVNWFWNNDENKQYIDLVKNEIELYLEDWSDDIKWLLKDWKSYKHNLQNIARYKQFKSVLI